MSIQDGKLVCDVCLYTQKVTKCLRVYVCRDPNKKGEILDWDVCESCCRKKGW